LHEDFELHFKGFSQQWLYVLLRTAKVIPAALLLLAASSALAVPPVTQRPASKRHLPPVVTHRSEV